MATIYRFIVEGGGTGGGNTKSGTGSAKAKHAKKFKTQKSNDRPTGVEFNRYQRITTTLGNKATGGQYSQALRLGKASLNVASSMAMGTGIPVLGLMIIVQYVIRLINEHVSELQRVNEQYNKADMKKLQVGKTQISTNFETSRHIINGRIKFNEND